VVDDKILSKNILGAFYLPQLVFCVNEAFLTISTSSAHATVGEACKTMNMLGVADHAVGRRDYANIVGGEEFASDFTKILLTVEGFESLVEFIQCEHTKELKSGIMSLGRQIADVRQLLGSPDAAAAQEELDELILARRAAMSAFQSRYREMSQSRNIEEFLSTINLEIVKAKAMFLAHSDPFEKKRALLFEYAHTMGHGVEAFMNGLYHKARCAGLQFEDAIKQHGQFVGMAVVWAGKMSSDLGHLNAEGFTLHQSFVYLFNRFGGFDFSPLRRLCDELGVGEEEFCEGVLQVVRRDNKRGYTECSDCAKSVDQLVMRRPGQMLRSEDPNAELRYLVEVDEAWQREVLLMAFKGEFDQKADIRAGELSFVGQTEEREAPTSSCVAQHIWQCVRDLYEEDLKTTALEDFIFGECEDDESPAEVESDSEWTETGGSANSSVESNLCDRAGKDSHVRGVLDFDDKTGTSYGNFVRKVSLR